MRLSTEKQYLFTNKLTGELFIQSSKVVVLDKEPTSTGKVRITVQNYIESNKKRKRKISVDNFNKMGLSFVGEL